MKIIIVDDDCLVAGALKTILEANPDIQVAATGSDGEEACSLYREYLPDILLMDIRMKGMDGLEASRKILGEFPEAKILLLTTFSDDEYIIKALKIGAKGYLLKQNFNGIAPALEAVLQGQQVFGEQVITRLPILMQNKPNPDYAKYAITDKEKELIELVAAGLSNKEIAAALFLSEGTVRNYLSSILEKLHLRDRTQLAVFYYTNRTD